MPILGSLTLEIDGKDSGDKKIIYSIMLSLKTWPIKILVHQTRPFISSIKFYHYPMTFIMEFGMFLSLYLRHLRQLLKHFKSRFQSTKGSILQATILRLSPCVLTLDWDTLYGLVRTCVHCVSSETEQAEIKFT